MVYTEPFPQAGSRAGDPPRIDPTKNVLDTLNAAIKRLDDLDAAERVRNQDLHLAETRRMDGELASLAKIMAADVVHIKETATLRAAYEERLQIAEAKRIDANRSGDAAAVSVASERAGAQAIVLANQLTATAETSRAQVAQTATTMRADVEKFSAQVTERLTSLERSSARGEGKQAVSDPASERLAIAVEKLIAAQAVGAGKSMGAGALVAWIFGGVGMFSAVVSIVVMLMRMKP